jgi:hypothetical protein
MKARSKELFGTSIERAIQQTTRMTERMSLSPAHLPVGDEKTWCESIVTDGCDDVIHPEAWTGLRLSVSKHGKGSRCGLHSMRSCVTGNRSNATTVAYQTML